VTPFNWTRGRLLSTAASLLVIFSTQVLKWQERASAGAETIRRSLRFRAGTPRAFSSTGNIL
jgi:hypothetical protein